MVPSWIASGGSFFFGECSSRARHRRWRRQFVVPRSSPVRLLCRLSVTTRTIRPGSGHDPRMRQSRTPIFSSIVVTGTVMLDSFSNPSTSRSRHVRPDVATKAWYAIFLLLQIPHYPEAQPAGFCYKSLVGTFFFFPRAYLSCFAQPPSLRLCGAPPEASAVDFRDVTSLRHWRSAMADGLRQFLSCGTCVFSAPGMLAPADFSNTM